MFPGEALFVFGCLMGYMQCSGDARRIRKRLSNLPCYVGSKLAFRCHGNVIRAEFVDARYTIHKYSVCNVAGFRYICRHCSSKMHGAINIRDSYIIRGCSYGCCAACKPGTEPVRKRSILWHVIALAVSITLSSLS